MKETAVFFIKLYQKILSPLKIRPSCIFYPTCSQYAIEAIREHGIIVGIFLSVGRILRCNPFNNHGGLDPVPKKKIK